MAGAVTGDSWGSGWKDSPSDSPVPDGSNGSEAGAVNPFELNTPFPASEERGNESFGKADGAGLGVGLANLLDAGLLDAGLEDVGLEDVGLEDAGLAGELEIGLESVGSVEERTGAVGSSGALA